MKALFKKSLALLLSAMMLFTAVPFAASAAATAEQSVGASSGTTGDCTWTLDDNGTLTISGNGAMGNYSKDYYNGTWITSAPWGANIKSVVIENGVTSIGDEAFFGCTGLTSVTIPDSVTSIEYRAFEDCTELTMVTIPDSVTSIGSYAFESCIGLTSVTIGNSVTSIGEGAFSGCTGLSSVTIPDSVTSIGGYAFLGTAWYNNQPNGLVYAGKVACAYKGRMPSKTSIVLKDGTKGIARFAFEDCTGLTGITIPDSVTSIGNSAFAGCTGLTSVTIPDSVTSIGNTAFHGCTGLTSVTIGNSVTSIGEGAFYVCTGLTSITIPDSVTSIGFGAFGGCTGLTSVTIGNSVTSIEESAFLRCQQISDVYYGGNEAQWNSINIDNDNDCLTSAVIHYNSFTGILTPVNFNSGSSGSSSQSNSVSVKTPSNSILDIELEKDLGFTVPSNVPLIGGKAMKLDLSFVPLTAAVTENSIKIGIGYNRDLTSGTDEQTWCNWKNYVKGYKDAVSKGTELFGDVVNKKKGIASAGMGKDLDFEFYGYFEGTIQNGQVIGSGVAKIKLEGALKNEWQTAIGFVPIVVKLKGLIGVENTASLSLNFSTKKLSFENQLDITLPQITASAGVGIAHIADVSVYGDAKNVFSIYSKPKKITGTLFGELGVSAKALFWSAQLPILSVGNGSGWTYYDSTKKSISSSVGAFDYDDLNFTIDRSYLKNQSEWLSGKSKAPEPVGTSGYDAFTYTALQTSIYDGAAPKLIKTNDDMILVWIGDDKTRSDGNQTVVYYSVFDNDSSTWNAPIAVEDNGTADFTPEIASDGENTYLAWADAKTTFDGNAEMNEVAAACEIKLAKFNANAKTFENIVQLTDNNTLDISPNIAVKNGSVSVVWKNNSANAFLENAGTETIYKATKTANGFVTNSIYSSPNKIYELVTDGENTVVSVDGDGNLTDATDSEIFAIDSQNFITQLTDNSSGENNLAFSNINGQTMLTYLCDGTLYSSADLETVTALSDTDTLIFGKYQFAGNKLFSVESVGESAEIFSYSINEEGLWSNPVQVSFTEKYIRNPAFVDNNGEIDCVFLNTSAVISDDDVTETTDLCTSVIPDFHSIEIKDISYDSDDVIPGESLPVTIALCNNGTVNENAFTISILDEKGSTVANTNISKNIKSGQTAELTAALPLDSTLNSKTTYTVTVNGTSCNDSDELSVGYTQLMLSTQTGIQDDTLGVLLNVTNDSSIATNARLVVKASEDAEGVLDTFVLGKIGANTSLSYFLNNEKICAYKAQTDSLYLELVSDKDEISLADNTAIVGLSSFSQFKLGDLNSDGTVNISDVTTIQRYLTKAITFTDEQLAVADTNGDGKVDISDATYLQMYLAKYNVVLGEKNR